MRISYGWALGLLLSASSASADRVVLLDGAVIDGRATRQGDKVLIEMSSGQISLDAAVVVRIEEAESDLDRYEQKLHSLKPRDLKGALELANFCRDHDMRAQESEMLRRVIEIDPDHEDARARLGFVKGAHGYVTFAQAQREKGLLLRDGQWVTREQALELDKLAAETKRAELARDREELARDREELAVERERVELTRARESAERDQEESKSPPANDTRGMSVWFGSALPAGCVQGTCNRVAPASREPSRFINGAHDPRDQRFAIPGARDPRSYF